VEVALLEIIEDLSQPLEVRRRAIEAISPLSNDKVKKIIEEAYNSHLFPLRLSSIYVMGRNSDPIWLPILIKELSSPYPQIRYEAACACGEMGERELVPCLLPLLEDDDPEVQHAAVQALGKIGGKEAKQALLHCLHYGDDFLRPAVREALLGLEILEE
jgi:HEAT repeat protein